MQSDHRTVVSVLLGVFVSSAGCFAKQAPLQSSAPASSERPTRSAPTAPVEPVEPRQAVAVQPEAPGDRSRAEPPQRPLDVRVLAPPPFAATVRSPASIEQSPRPVLKKLSQSRNRITDDEAWFEDNDLRLPIYEVSDRGRGMGAPRPSHVPLEFRGFRLVQAIAQDSLTIAVYGPDYSGGTMMLVIDAEGVTVAALDFEQWTRGPADVSGERDFTQQRVTWAVVEQGVLFVSHGHRTYARSSGGKNAYISAIDLATGDLLWQSAPLVANARTFLVEDGWIITGYGFTNEPDFLFVLDARTGKTAERIKLRKGPTYILRKDDRVFVRTYDTDYVFSIGG